LSGNKGIYEAVEMDSPKEDSRRKSKPDGSWLPKVGKKYPGAVSYWSQEGLEKYAQSGLMDWHASVVNHPVQVLVIMDKPVEILYEDEYQIIVDPKEIVGTKTISMENLGSAYLKGVDFKGEFY
jgi:hypothetical protein